MAYPEPTVSGVVWYQPVEGEGRPALIRGILPREGRLPHLNLAVISLNGKQRDQYGAQKVSGYKTADVPHESDAATGGHYYKLVHLDIEGNGKDIPKRSE